MIVVLRGHIRNSFQTRTLYFFLKRISASVPNVRLYIHTWNVAANSTSWRHVPRDDTPVTEDVVRAYLGDLSVRHIIVDDDRFITLHGNLDGKVARTKMPVLGWKNYWYGQFRILHHLAQHEKSSDTVLSCRFDVFDNSNSFALEAAVSFAQRHAVPLQRNVFLLDQPFRGMDNLYAGSVRTVYALCEQFHFRLDQVLRANPDCQNQEFLVHRTNALLFPPTPLRIKQLAFTHKMRKANHTFKKD